MLIAKQNQKKLVWNYVLLAIVLGITFYNLFTKILFKDYFSAEEQVEEALIAEPEVGVTRSRKIDQAVFQDKRFKGLTENFKEAEPYQSVRRNSNPFEPFK